MARSSRRGERDTDVVASPEFDRLLAPVSLSAVSLPVREPVLPSGFSDLRLWSPTVEGVPYSSELVPARIVESDSLWRPAPMSVTPSVGRTASPAAPRFQFADARYVALCFRRRARREVLFAYRRTGKGAGSKRRRNAFTEVSC